MLPAGSGREGGPHQRYEVLYPSTARPFCGLCIGNWLFSDLVDPFRVSCLLSAFFFATRAAALPTGERIRREGVATLAGCTREQGLAGAAIKSLTSPCVSRADEDTAYDSRQAYQEVNQAHRTLLDGQRHWLNVVFEKDACSPRMSCQCKSTKRCLEKKLAKGCPPGTPRPCSVSRDMSVTLYWFVCSLRRLAST